MTDKQLPHNDPNLKLAHAIGQARETGTPLSELNDSIVSPLLEHRKRMHRLQPVNNSEKQKVWQQIKEATASSTEKAAIHRLFATKTYRWAAAAVVFIAALFSFLYIQHRQQPELLAQSRTSIKIIHLDDGSTVTLRPHSSLFEIKQSASVLFYKLKGEALFEVTPKKLRTFTVNTESGRVSVLGTRFILSSWGSRMQVFLEEGSVKVQSRQANNAIILQPGEAASVNEGGNITRIQNVNVQEFTDWLKQQLIFNSEPVAQVVIELEQQFSIYIELPEKVAERRLSGQLSLKSLQISLNDLGLALGGTFVRTGERSYRFEGR